MNRNFKILFLILFAIIIYFGISFFYNRYLFEDKMDGLINISNLSVEFMENYFKDMIDFDDGNSDNILIVSSLNDISDNYGAVKMVKAPNNQYFIKYDSKAAKEIAFEKFKASKEIVSVEENNSYEALEANYNSWGIKAIGLDSAIEITNQGNFEDVTVAIIDSGCNMDLFNKNYKGKILETYNPYDYNGMYDNSGHGTHIAGTIAEGTSSNVHILPIKVGDSKSFNTTAIITAINYVNYYHKADVINMSFGEKYSNFSLEVAIESALKNNIISIAGSGNSGTNEDTYPASFDNTISVSAVNSNYLIADFSNHNDHVTFAAPGVFVNSINGTLSGTSMSTPHVSCAVALLKSINKSLTMDQVVSLLKDYAIDLGPDGKDSYFGYGVIDLKNFSEIMDRAIGFNGDISDIEILNIPKLSVNYGNITNLMNIKVKIYDKKGNEYIKYFSDLNELEIYDYDAFSCGTQVVRFKYKNIEKSFSINNLSCDNIDAYKYSVLDDGLSISITEVRNQNFNYDDSSQYEDFPRKIYIPEYIDDYKVISIGKEVFLFSTVNQVILPDSIISIGDSAFSSSDIVSVVGGGEEVFVGKSAFSGATYLKIFEPTIYELGESAFSGAKNLKNISVSDKLKVIKKSAFANCFSLKNLDFLRNVEEVNDNSFANTNISDLKISKSISKIDMAFKSTSELETIEVDEENTVYDSRNNSNAIIETSTDKLILGSGNTIIPSDVKEIDSFAFYNNKKIRSIDTNNVETIGRYAFYGCSNLEEVYLSESVKTLGFNSLYKIPTVYGYNDDFYDELLNKQNVSNFVNIMSGEVEVEGPSEYNAFDKVSDIIINIKYSGFGYFGLFNETIDNGYSITYENGEYIKYGDSYYTVSFITKYGIKMEKRVNITVKKAIPQFIIPDSLKSYVGFKLGDVSLPEGFEWTDDSIVFEQEGNFNFKAKYFPDDADNYETVDDIDIPIIIYANDLYNPNDYEGYYDGVEHTINVNEGNENCDIRYSVNSFDYNLTDLPKFKKPGEYVVNYKSSCDNANHEGTGKIKIYGIKEFDSSIVIKNNILLFNDNKFSNIKNKITVYSNSVSFNHFDRNKLLIDSDLVKTGDNIAININNFKKYEYVTSIIGDVNGDGLINKLDIDVLTEYIIFNRLYSLGKAYYYASDSNNDDIINVIDIVKIANERVK